MPRSINPYTLKVLAEYQEHSSAEVDLRIENAHQAFQNFRRTSFANRSKWMLRLAQKLVERREQLAQLMTAEMGKPITQSRAEISKCAWVCEYYAENASEFLSDRHVKTDARKSYVTYEPLGVILAVMPWNFPFWQVFRFLAPTLMAGNTALLKHASNVTGCALEIENLVRDAGFPVGVFRTLILPGARVEEVIQDSRCRGVSLTGSGPAGSSVAALAGKYLKPSLLELGGSNPFVVFQDANLDQAIDLAVQARIQNSGQSCIAAKRFLIHESIADEFVLRLTARFQSLRAGDPTSEECDVGPLARVDLAEELSDQVRRSVEEGAELLLGGHREQALFEPTILIGVRPNMSVWQEETFGPVAAVMTYTDKEDLLEKAEHPTFGLGVTLCTQDVERALALAPHFNEGAVFINEMVKSDPRLPFGGVKDSGFGRELGREGILAFINTKTVFVG
ncbi:NAD-dependent succinate-semialdehyde dehydrogenase [Cryomorphaceae bacterium]|nr:NAD-dependent succinate-semialdehyde dehydrogenase [Cryomorphaceae bacterium]